MYMVRASIGLHGHLLTLFEKKQNNIPLTLFAVSFSSLLLIYYIFYPRMTFAFLFFFSFFWGGGNQIIYYCFLYVIYNHRVVVLFIDFLTHMSLSQEDKVENLG